MIRLSEEALDAEEAHGSVLARPQCAALSSFSASMLEPLDDRNTSSVMAWSSEEMVNMQLLPGSLEPVAYYTRDTCCIPVVYLRHLLYLCLKW